LTIIFYSGQRILRELLIWSKLDHPHIVPLLGYYFSDVHAKYPCPVLPLMEGGTLNDRIRGSAITPENRRTRLGFVSDDDVVLP
jgi:serine/threonine protein kinase